MVSKCNLPHLSFTVFDRTDLDWAAHANPKKDATINVALSRVLSRANDRIDAYMKSNFKPPTTDAQKAGYQGQMDLYELEVKVMAHQVMSDDKKVKEQQEKLAEKTAELKILPPKLSGEAGASMYKEGLKKASASSKRQKVEASKAAHKPLSKLGNAVEKLNKEDKSYLEKFLGDGDDAKALIQHIKMLEQVQSQVPQLPAAAASQSDSDKDDEITKLKRKIQGMEDTACCVIEKAHDNGVKFPVQWLTRLNFVGYVPGPDVADVSSLMSGRSNLSGFEMPHGVYKDVTVSIRQVRWPRKYLEGGTKYGMPCPESELLELVDEADKIDITSHEA